jgi:hypothetical protein
MVSLLYLYRFFVDGYGCIRTHHVAKAASDTVVGIMLLGGTIALAVELVREAKHFLRAEVDT